MWDTIGCPAPGRETLHPCAHEQHQLDSVGKEEEDEEEIEMRLRRGCIQETKGECDINTLISCKKLMKNKQTPQTYHFDIEHLLMRQAGSKSILDCARDHAGGMWSL